GQRVFSADVPESGEVAVIGPRLFLHCSPDYRARFPDQPPLPEKPANDVAMGFWWLKQDGETEVYLVGTKADYDTYWRDHPFEHPHARPKGHGGGKGGHDGGGRRGGSGRAGHGGGDPAMAGPPP